MQYSGYKTDVPAIKWGVEHEQEAREAYAHIMAVKHATFKMNPAGLQVCTKQPFLAATPDGVVSCSCCSEGLIEIKCPFKYWNSQPASYRMNPSTFTKLTVKSHWTKNMTTTIKLKGRWPSGRNHTVTLLVGQLKG